MPTEDDPNEERDRLNPDDSLNMPAGFQQAPSVWESVVVARFGGASRYEQAELASAAYTGFVDRTTDPMTRAAARDEAIAGFNYFDVSFDWGQWRREMGY